MRPARAAIVVLALLLAACGREPAPDELTQAVPCTADAPAMTTLSETDIAANNPDEDFWQSVGAAIHEFHAAGVYHADMNAYNLQIDKDGLLWMLDFDKGSLKPPGPWQQQTLSRLHRSLHKIKNLDPKLNFRAMNWEQLLEGYFNASRSE